MFRAETALASPAATAPRGDRGSHRSHFRRDPRRFGQASVWLLDDQVAEPESRHDDMRLFAHSFAGFFLFFSLLIA